MATLKMERGTKNSIPKIVFKRRLQPQIDMLKDTKGQIVPNSGSQCIPYVQTPLVVKDDVKSGFKPTSKGSNQTMRAHLENNPVANNQSTYLYQRKARVQMFAQCLNFTSW